MVASRRRSTATPTNKRRRAGSSNHLQRIRQIHFAPGPSDGQQPLQATNLNEKKYAEARKAMANFWYFCNIPFDAARSSYYDEMVNALITCGAEFEPPTYDSYRESLLFWCMDDTLNERFNEHKKIWVTKGCTIMFDGCRDEKGRTIINILVASTQGLKFLKSVDASDKINDGQALFTLLENAVLEVEPQNVVQVITDNTPAYVAAGKLLEERFSNIFWTTCAAYCIDLMLEDIGKISWVKEIVDNAKKITKYIYNHSWALSLMRQYTDGREIFQPGVTRFATDFLTLQSLYSKRYGLKRMFVSNEWTESTFSTSEETRLVEKIIFDEQHFWETSHEVIQVTEPLVKVLHIVHSQDESPMGYLYEAMNKVKEAIAEFYENIEPKYRPFWELIDRRWSGELHKPIHAAGYYLNPKYFFDEAFVVDEEIFSGLHTCLQRMVQDDQKIEDIRRELEIYKNAEGCLFSSAFCIRSRKTLNPTLWWDSFGMKTPLLQQIAIRILSQRCNSFACERNWSMFEHIHSKNCNKLAQDRLNMLECVHYSLMFHRKQIDGADHDAIGLDEFDPTSEWITELETRQPSEEEDFVLMDNQVKQELAVVEE